MDVKPVRIFPLGDNAVTVEFGNEMSEPLNSAAISLADHINNNPFPGFVEAVPAVASTTIFYRPFEVRDTADEFSTAFDRVTQFAIDAVDEAVESNTEDLTVHEIPVSFGPQDSLDLEAIAKYSGLGTDDVIEVFLSNTYRVYMLGFLLGFAYMGTVDERIAMPRRSSPRVAVPKGSVGIAGRQTGIYPSESPGGWQIIGRTDVQIVTGDQQRPCLFKPGDSVKFIRT